MHLYTCHKPSLLAVCNIYIFSFTAANVTVFRSHQSVLLVIRVESQQQNEVKLLNHQPYTGKHTLLEPFSVCLDKLQKAMTAGYL